MSLKGATKTWELTGNTSDYFTHFRITQTGFNSNHSHHLACSGFELYGTVIYSKNVVIATHDKSAKKKDFKYNTDMDMNGLFYWLGTKGGIKSTWSNPASAGLVEATASSLMSDSQPITHLVGRTSVRCLTKAYQNSWMKVNLEDIKIKLSHYTLRHYSSWDTGALRHWNLEGSNDGYNWTVIRQHVDDRSLRKAGGTHTWSVNSDRYFSQFRIMMTGENSNNNWYLACSVMELYGNAYGGHSECTLILHTQNF